MAASLSAWVNGLQPNELAILLVVLPVLPGLVGIAVGWIVSSWMRARRERREARWQQRTWLKESLEKYVKHMNSYWLTEGASTEQRRKDVVGVMEQAAYLAHRLPKWLEDASTDAKESGHNAFAEMRESGEGGSFGDCAAKARPDPARTLRVGHNAGALRAAIDEV